MRVLICGGSGFIGTALTKSLLKDADEVTILTRRPEKAGFSPGAKVVEWDGRNVTSWGNLVSRTDAIVNLVGENIGSLRWTRRRKEILISSRVNAGKAITEAIRVANHRPQLLVQASAVGFYGPRGQETIAEDVEAGSDYQCQICKQWEASTQLVEEWGVRRVVIRTGVVLSKTDGALPRMLLPFRLFAGGPLGSGKQGFPWIHLEDELGAIRFLMRSETASGVFNLGAPNPISNADFGRALAKAMNRPYWLPVPAFALRLLLGEMSTVVLDGQYMVPKRLLEMSYHFRFETAEVALEDVFKS